jgi:mono/diheme cytochrome c family protein
MTLAAFAAAGGDAPRPAADAAPPPRDGRAVFVEQGCGSCHRFAPAGSAGPIGPDLGLALHGKDAASVERQILAPPKDTIMPDDYATRINPPDLDALVEFLLGAQ